MRIGHDCFIVAHNVVARRALTVMIMYGKRRKSQVVKQGPAPSGPSSRRTLRTNALTCSGVERMKRCLFTRFWFQSGSRRARTRRRRDQRAERQAWHASYIRPADPLALYPLLALPLFCRKMGADDRCPTGEWCSAHQTTGRGSAARRAASSHTGPARTAATGPGTAEACATMPV
jgi:hypothetical protein